MAKSPDGESGFTRASLSLGDATLKPIELKPDVLVELTVLAVFPVRVLPVLPLLVIIDALLRPFELCEGYDSSSIDSSVVPPLSLLLVVNTDALLVGPSLPLSEPNNPWLLSLSRTPLLPFFFTPSAPQP